MEQPKLFDTNNDDTETMPAVNVDNIEGNSKRLASLIEQLGSLSKIHGETYRAMKAKQLDFLVGEMLNDPTLVLPENLEDIPDQGSFEL